MNKTPRIALLISGPTRPELLTALPALARGIGPVKSATFQQARRVVNAIRHGEAVRALDSLRDAKVILCAGSPAREMAEELGQIERTWRGSLVIFAGPPEADPAPSLARQGANVATATLLPSARGKAFCLVSGSAEASKLLRSYGARVLRASKGSAQDYRTATELIAEAIPQILETSAAKLKNAGLSTADLRTVLEEQAAVAVRAYLRTRKRPAISDEIKRLATRMASGAGVP